MKYVAAFVATALVAGCAVRLGGPGPVEYDTIAIEFDQSTSVTEAASRLRDVGAELALIATPQDAEWVRQLAAQLQLPPTDPGRLGGLTLAFLGLKPAGDTTLTLTVATGGSIHLHDALYYLGNEKKQERPLDLMTAIVQPGTPAREGVRRLIEYIASDVGATAAVVLAVKAPTPVIADSIAELTRAAWGDVWECTDAGKRRERAPAILWRMYYFPPARMRCSSARVLGTENRPSVAKLVVGG